MADTAAQKAEDSLEAEAMAALHSLFPGQDSAAREPVAVAETPTSETAQAEPAETAAPVTEDEPVAETDDVAALKAELEAARKESDSIRQRFDKTAAWSRDLALRKSNDVAVRDQLLQRMARGEEVTKEEVEKILAGGQQAPQYQAQPYNPLANPFAPAPVAGPDPAITEVEASRFMVEHRMSDEDAAKMVAWMQKQDSGLTPDDMVPNNTYQTLRLVHEKYVNHLNAERATTATKVAGVARTQRAVAKAAGAITGAAKATPSTPVPPDPATMSPDDFEKSGALEKALSEILQAGRG